MSTATAPATTVRKKTSATTLRLVRKTHLYLGLFISPALLFFAFTGAVQMLSLHEAGGKSYTPPAVLAELGQIHKHAGIATPVPDPPAKAGQVSKSPKVETSPKLEQSLASKQRQHLPMKIFFVLVAAGLLTSTVTGIYMSYKYERNKLLVTGVLVAGVLVPLVLLKF